MVMDQFGKLFEARLSKGKFKERPNNPKRPDGCDASVYVPRNRLTLRWNACCDYMPNTQNSECQLRCEGSLACIIVSRKFTPIKMGTAE